MAAQAASPASPCPLAACGGPPRCCRPWVWVVAAPCSPRAAVRASLQAALRPGGTPHPCLSAWTVPGGGWQRGRVGRSSAGAERWWCSGVVQEGGGVCGQGRQGGGIEGDRHASSTWQHPSTRPPFLLGLGPPPKSVTTARPCTLTHTEVHATQQSRPSVGHDITPA